MRKPVIVSGFAMSWRGRASPREIREQGFREKLQFRADDWDAKAGAPGQDAICELRQRAKVLPLQEKARIGRCQRITRSLNSGMEPLESHVKKDKRSSSGDRQQKGHFRWLQKMQGCYKWTLPCRSWFCCRRSSRGNNALLLQGSSRVLTHNLDIVARNLNDISRLNPRCRLSF